MVRVPFKSVNISRVQPLWLLPALPYACMPDLLHGSDVVDKSPIFFSVGKNFEDRHPLNNDKTGQSQSVQANLPTFFLHVYDFRGICKQ